ncbi:DUF1310 domain-containing protein [Streptococcus suis]|nr:DUF1310 domain-containing protein [Streptococcus suis]
MKKVLRILFGIAFSVCIVIGGYKLMKQIEYNQMVEIVKSDEVKEIIEKRLKYLDANGLTENGIIKSYEIDVNSVSHNPMGGITFKIYLNSDKELRMVFELGKGDTGKIEYSGGGYSPQVKDLVKVKMNE